MYRDELPDTGWKQLSLASGVSNGSSGYGGSNGLQYRKIGNHVYIRGGVSFTSTSGSKQVATLPSGYRPKYNVYSFSPMTGHNIARIMAHNNGSLSVEWYNKLSNDSWVTGSISWISCIIDFWTD